MPVPALAVQNALPSPGRTGLFAEMWNDSKNEINRQTLQRFNICFVNSYKYACGRGRKV